MFICLFICLFSHIYTVHLLVFIAYISTDCCITTCIHIFSSSAASVINKFSAQCSVLVLSCTVKRYGNLLAENCKYYLPLSHSAPCSVCSLRNIAGEVNQEKLVMQLSCSEYRMILVWVVFIQYQRVTDGGTDGQTDGFIMAGMALCIASYIYIFIHQQSTDSKKKKQYDAV